MINGLWAGPPHCNVSFVLPSYIPLANYPPSSSISTPHLPIRRSTQFFQAPLSLQNLALGVAGGNGVQNGKYILPPSLLRVTPPLIRTPPLQYRPCPPPKNGFTFQTKLLFLFHTCHHCVTSSPATMALRSHST